jgi:hypothetical protein
MPEDQDTSSEPTTDIFGQEVESEETPEAPELVTVKIDGKTLQVTQEVADALQAREQDFNRRLSRQGDELGELRRTVQSIQAKPVTEEPADDPDLEFYRSPTKAIDSRLQADREAIKKEVRDEYLQERARETFWGTFYREHPDLVGREIVVEAVLAKQWEQLKDGEGAEGRKALASSVYTVLGTAPATFKKTLPNKGATSERPTTSVLSRRPASTKDETGPISISEVLKKRREDRRLAAAKPQARTSGSR